jgi:spermidine synthase
LQAQARAWPLGRALALNTAGAALAPLLVGVWLVPALGAGTSLACLVLGYLALQPPVAWRRVGVWLPAGAGCALMLWGTPLRFVELPEGGQVLSYREGVMAAVSVVADADGVARLRINNRAQEGSSAGSVVEWRLAQLPLLLHPGPQRALFLGLGTGMTARVAAQDPALQVDAVELLPEVIDAAAQFAAAQPTVRPARPVHIVAADARRYSQASAAQYDVIVADLFHPARSGAGSLYTVEQFAAVRQRLAPGGLFCQWLALHQMDLDTLRSIVAAFLQVYPEGMAVLASNSLDTPVLGLIARPDQARFAVQAVQDRLAHRAWATRTSPSPGTAALDDEFAVLGSVLAGPAALARWTAGAPANTDDHPLVVHSAPWDTYAPKATPRQRLLALITALQPSSPEVLAGPASPMHQRLQAYWGARQRYLEFGMTVTPDADPAVMLRRVQAPLLAVLHQSPDFQPAYAPLQALAQAVAPSHPELAQATLRAVQAELQREHEHEREPLPDPAQGATPLPPSS